MVEPAPANAEHPSQVTGQRRRDAMIGLYEAAEITGLSLNTCRRRLDKWLEGDRSDYALKGGRAGPAGARRYVDREDAQALAEQLAGVRGPGRHQPST